MNAQKRLGIVLIILGILILLDQLQVFSVSAKHFVAFSSVLLGGLLIKKALKRPKRGGLLAGSFFLIWGAFFFFLNCYACPKGRILFWGQFFLSLGLANLIYFLFSGVTKSLNLFAFVLYAAIGGTMLGAFYGKLDIWRLENLLNTYWPVILILLGLFILVDSYWNNRHNSQAEISTDSEPKDNQAKL